MTERDQVVAYLIVMVATFIGFTVLRYGLYILDELDKAIRPIARQIDEDHERLMELLRRIQTAKPPPDDEDLPWAEEITERLNPLCYRERGKYETTLSEFPEGWVAIEDSKPNPKTNIEPRKELS